METLTLSYEELDRVSVIERVIEKRLTQLEAARMLGLTSRQVRRLRRAYERDGPVGLASKHRGRPSNRQLSSGLRQEALALVRSQYEDFGPTLAHEKLTELHGLAIYQFGESRAGGLFLRTDRPRQDMTCRLNEVGLSGHFPQIARQTETAFADHVALDIRAARRDRPPLLE